MSKFLTKVIITFKCGDPNQTLLKLLRPSQTSKYIFDHSQSHDMVGNPALKWVRSKIFVRFVGQFLRSEDIDVEKNSRNVSMLWSFRGLSENFSSKTVSFIVIQIGKKLYLDDLDHPFLLLLFKFITKSNKYNEHKNNSLQIFGDDRSPLSSAEDEDDDGVALIPNPPHNEYNPGGTNTLYTVFLIVNAALGAGNPTMHFLN
jgi:hypothetical protein